MVSLFNLHGHALINLLQFIEDNISGTDTESDNGTLSSKCKRCPEDQRYVMAGLSSHPALTTLPRNVKRTKSHQSLADVHPTVLSLLNTSSAQDPRFTPTSDSDSVLYYVRLCSLLFISYLIVDSARSE